MIFPATDLLSFAIKNLQNMLPLEYLRTYIILLDFLLGTPP